MIKGIVAAVPKNTVRNEDTAFMRLTGVEERRIAVGRENTLSLGAKAVDVLLESLGWSAASIGTVICVTQTPACRMPHNSAAIAQHIGLENRPCFDVNLACSGYVYGLWLASKMRSRTLLVVGDTVSKLTDGTDKLFGDAVTATAVEHDRYSASRFVVGTAATGYDDLIADPTIRMDGAEVMKFALESVPPLVFETTQNCRIDWHLFHQANKAIIQRIVGKCKIDPAKAPINIQKYGNTSSASIPLLMCDSEATQALKTRRNRIALFGFGAGFSYAGALLDTMPIKVLEVVE